MRYLCFKILIFSFFFLGCGQQKAAPDNCMENPNVEGKLLVIVGEKVSIKVMPQEGGSLDGKFLATYIIKELVCGKYSRDTISFIAYDHYGYPGFSNYKNAMLFLSDYDSVIYHQKYQFFDMYKTKDGRWASSYQTDDYWRSSGVKPVPIEFAEEVSYNIAGGKKKLIKQYYPEPYFRLTKEKAIAVWGNYIPELFQLKKDGILKARGLFGIPGPNPQFMETQMAEIDNDEFVSVTKTEKDLLTNTFTKLISAIKTRNTEQIREMSLDSIYCSICEGIRDDYYDNDLDDIKNYIDSAYQHFPDEKIWGPADGRFKLKFSADKYKKTKPANFKLKENEKLLIYHVFFYELSGKKSPRFPMPKSHIFKFVKIDGNFKLYGMTSN